MRRFDPRGSLSSHRGSRQPSTMYVRILNACLRTPSLDWRQQKKKNGSAFIAMNAAVIPAVRIGTCRFLNLARTSHASTVCGVAAHLRRSKGGTAPTPVVGGEGPLHMSPSDLSSTCGEDSFSECFLRCKWANARGTPRTFPYLVSASHLFLPPVVYKR